MGGRGARAGLEVADLRAALARQVDAVAIPRRFRVVATLPREDSGKLPRERLAALFDVRPPAAVAARERHTRIVRIPMVWSYFDGHFDGFPILPGVAQMTEVVLPGVAAHWPHLRHVRRIVALKFRSPIAPGDALELELTLAAPLKVGFALRRQTETVSSGTLEFGAEAG